MYRNEIPSVPETAGVSDDAAALAAGFTVMIAQKQKSRNILLIRFVKQMPLSVMQADDAFLMLPYKDEALQANIGIAIISLLQVVWGAGPGVCFPWPQRP